MRRALRWTLAFAVTAVMTANITSRSDAAQVNIDTALQQSTAVSGKAQHPGPVPAHALRLQVGGALALSQPSLRARVNEPRRSRVTPRFSPRVALGSSVRSRLARWLHLGGTRPTLALPVTESISLGLGYSYQRSEDLAFKAATAGALDGDYQNHKLLLRAQWEF